MMSAVADRLRELIDLVLASLDEPGADGRALAGRAHFSRDHLDRLLAGATGESPVALRRRLLLERAAWQLRTGAASPAEAAAAAAYGSLAAFSRAFAARPRRAAEPLRRVRPTRRARGAQRHPLPPARRACCSPARARRGRGATSTDRLVAHHLDRVRELLRAAASLPARGARAPAAPRLRRRLVRGRGGERGADGRAARVHARGVGRGDRGRAGARRTAAATSLRRFERAARAFARLVRGIRARGAWDDAFVDALCEPPQSFTYGGVVAHVLAFGAVRREMLASVLAELGADVPTSGDPIEWEAERT